MTDHRPGGGTTRLRGRPIPSRSRRALLITSGAFLHGRDFTGRFTEHGASAGTPLAAIDWDAAIVALNAPIGARCLAAGIPVDLRDAVTGLDDRNTQHPVLAVLRACGHPRSLPGS
jgi:hypothetical protein